MANSPRAWGRRNRVQLSPPRQGPARDRGGASASPSANAAESVTDPKLLTRLNIRRRDRLGDILHEYEHSAPTRAGGISAGMASGLAFHCRGSFARTV